MTEKKRRSDKKIDPKDIAEKCREYMNMIEDGGDLTAPQKDKIWSLMNKMITFLEDNGYIDTIEDIHNRVMTGLDIFANNKCPEMAADCKGLCPYAESEDCMLALIDDAYTCLKAMEEEDG